MYALQHTMQRNVHAATHLRAQQHTLQRNNKNVRTATHAATARTATNPATQLAHCNTPCALKRNVYTAPHS